MGKRFLKVEVFESGVDWKWRILTADRKPLAVSCRVFGSKAQAQRGLQTFLDQATMLPLSEKRVRQVMQDFSVKLSAVRAASLPVKVVQ